MRILHPGAVVACLALGAYAVLMGSLGRLEWIDAHVASYFEVLRGCEGHEIVRTLSDLAPWLSAALIVLAVALGVRRGLSAGELLVPLALLGVALLEAQALKTLFERDRPGIPPWQEASGHAFPSGHVVNAALCAVTTVLLMFRGTRERGRLLAAIAVAAAYVGGVAFTRLYLGRHWATDVTGAALLGLAFWGVCAAWPLRAPRLVGALVGVQILGFFLAVEAGGRVHLPAPTMLAEMPHDGPAPLRGTRLARVVDGTWSVHEQRDGGGRFLRLAGNDVTFTVPEGLVRPSVLKVVAFPLRTTSRSRCAWMDVSVDGGPSIRRALKLRWRTLAFALPALGSGPHTVRLRFHPPREPGQKETMALRALSLETLDGPLAIVPHPDGHLVRSAPDLDVATQ